ncbi:MAG: CDP-alcohol phosphatidyltransferase family protein [Anaerolineales bacterium]|nr:MAG: CDP-alcohol phosphatidyltransferase family protein [Anaerolineales bacterium]
MSPNSLTMVGYVLSLLVMYVLATGQLQLGGVLVAVAAMFDALDGAVARAMGTTSTFGAFFDSVIDRYSEATVLFGLLLWYQGRAAEQEVALIYVTLLGSLMVSYARARAEGLGIACKVGWLTRFERVALLSIGLILQHVRLVLWVMAVLTNVTALQRVYHVWRVSRAEDDGPGSSGVGAGPTRLV